MRLKASATVAVVKNTPSACTSSSFSMPIACMNGIDGNDLNAGRRRNHAGDEADDAADPFLVAARDLEAEFAQADDGIDHQQQRRGTTAP